ncbi:MAG: hypothetical protein K2Z80_09680 [Xanthobacteraceae bacterium]|nr:hypothetical protein [Xanthobacteraceae bacterium]
MIQRVGTSIVAAVVVCLFAKGDPVHADAFKRVLGSQIQARFAGMELSDNVHWRDAFGRDGTVLSYSMGRKRTGKWHVENNELCIDIGRDSSGCYQVWISGANVQFRQSGMDDAVLEGILRRPVGGN